MDAQRRRHRELAPVGPLGTIDRAVDLARAGGSEVWMPAVGGGALVAFAVLLVYYVERIEGVHSLRPLLALGLVLAWWGRALLIGRAARRVVRGLWDAEEDPGTVLSMVRTAGVTGLALWLWSWVLMGASLAGPVGIAIVLPLFVLRGTVAPSWIARSACTRRGGWVGFGDAVRDNDGRRLDGLLIEAMLLAGAGGLAINLYALTLVGLMLMRSFGGLELGSVESFLSASNTFVMLAVASLALVLLEPVRAAHSAVLYVGSRVRAEGLDLRAALEDAVRHSKGRRRGRAAAAALVLLAIGLSAPRVEAQPELPPPPPIDVGEPAAESIGPEQMPPDIVPNPAPPPGFALEIDPSDQAVQDDVEQILAGDEFREFEDHRGDGLRDLIERLFEWIFRRRPDVPQLDASGVPSIPLPGAWVFLVIGAVLLLLVGVYVFVTYGPRAKKGEGAAAPASGLDPRERAPRSFLDEAAALAEAGDLRAALRALYLATLVSLDRRRWITFDPHLTNWQYLRHMPRGETRDAFRELTRLFDHKWYGEEETTQLDYRRCRELAAQIVEAGAVEEAA